MRNTPIITTAQPTSETNFSGSLKISHERITTAAYPKLTIGYAILSLTLERTINHDNALIPNTKSPKRTKGFIKAVNNFDGTDSIPDILPTFIIPYLSNI